MLKRRTDPVPNWPIGTKVEMVNCYEASANKGVVWVTRSEPYLLSGHTSVVFLEGWRGCFATKFLRVVDAENKNGR